MVCVTHDHRLIRNEWQTCNVAMKEKFRFKHNPIQVADQKLIDKLKKAVCSIFKWQNFGLCWSFIMWVRWRPSGAFMEQNCKVKVNAHVDEFGGSTPTAGKQLNHFSNRLVYVGQQRNKWQLFAAKVWWVTPQKATNVSSKSDGVVRVEPASKTICSLKAR